MGTELAATGNHVPSHSIQDVEVMAVRASKSGLFGMTTDQAFTLMQLCIAEGLHPIQAIKRYHIIEGKPSMRADAIQAEFQRHGGKVKWIESTGDACAAEFSHSAHHPDPYLVRITFAEMDAAGITRGGSGLKKNWRCFPAAMLRARVISAGVRMIDPGVIVGIYTPEEVADFDEPKAVQARIAEAPKEHHAINHDNNTGHGSGAYADPKAVEKYIEFVKKYAADRNAEWLDFHTDDATGECDAEDLVSHFRLNGHLHKFGRDNGKFNAPAEVRAEQKNKFTAIWFQRDPMGVEDEARAYCGKLWDDTRAKLEPRPEDESQEREPGADEAIDAEWADTEAMLAAEQAAT